MDDDVPRNLAELPRRAATRDSGHLALVAGDLRLTWAGLDARIDRAAAALRDGLGLAEGDRVAIQLGNTVDFAVTYFGVLRAGLVAVPVNTGYTLRELRHLLVDSGARVLVTSTVATIDARAELASALDGVRLVVAGRIAPEGAVALDDLLAAAGTPPAATRGGEDLALLIYTSGTSGIPKGAMLTHRALLANLDQCGRLAPPVVTPADVMLLVLPLFHIYGLNPGLGMVAWAGATAVLMDRFDAEESLALMARERVTTVVGAPAMYQAWAGHDVGGAFASVRLALSGAAPLPARTHERFAAAGVSVHEGYGLTETGPVLTSTLVGGLVQPGTIGRAIPGVELELRDEDGEPAEDGDPGEIVVRGPNLFSGYWPDGADGPDAEGWWPTGDVAYADEETTLHLVDRRKELVLVSGFNVYPAEVEAVLDTHPDVAEAAVIAVPDEHTGEAVKAYVVPRPGAELTADEVIEFAARSLARFKCPAVVEFVPALPHSATGKIRKGELRGVG